MAIAKDISQGMCIRYNNEIYKLKRKEVVAVGTHSHTKLKFFLKPFFGGGAERVVVFSHTDNIETLDLVKKKGQILSISGNNAQIMDLVSYVTHNAVIENENLELKEGEEAFFVEMEGKILIVDGK